MKTIIIPTDFSPTALNATNYAVDMALALNAAVLLLHVYQVPVSYNNNMDVPLPIIDINQMEEINKEKIQTLKEQLEHITSGKIKIDTDVRMGMLTEELEELSETVKPFAIVMGNKGGGAVERLLVGSSTLSAIKNLKWPIIVVPSGATFSGIRKIGFACDLKKIKETTPVAYLKEWAKAFDAELGVLNVDYNKDSFSEEIKSKTALLQSLLGEGVKTGFFFINNEDVETGINEFAENNNLDLLIVVPRKHNLFERLFQKSHASELVFHSHIPILSIHEKED
ncbi:MAG: universal stress protein [Agriterribacter sp.]